MGSTWKAAERRVAKALGGRRLPNSGARQEDVACARFSVEVKQGAQIPKLIIDAMEQAKRNAPEGKRPIMALHPKSKRTTYACVTATDLASVCPDLMLVMDLADLAAMAYNERGMTQ